MDKAKQLVNLFGDKLDNKIQDLEIMHRFADSVNQALNEAAMAYEAKYPPHNAEPMYKNNLLDGNKLYYSPKSSSGGSANQSPNNSPYQTTNERPNQSQNRHYNNIMPNVHQKNDDFNHIQNPNESNKHVPNHVDYMQHMNPRQDHMYNHDLLPNYNVDYMQHLNPIQQHLNPIQDHMHKYEQNYVPNYNKIPKQNDHLLNKIPRQNQIPDHYLNYNSSSILQNDMLSETLDAVVKKMLEPYLFGMDNNDHQNVQDVDKPRLNQDQYPCPNNQMPDNHIVPQKQWKHFNTIRNELHQKRK